MLLAVIFQEAGSTGHLAGGRREGDHRRHRRVISTSTQDGTVPTVPSPTFFSGKFISVIFFSFGNQCHYKIAGARSTTFSLASANSIYRMRPPVCWWTLCLHLLAIANYLLTLSVFPSTSWYAEPFQGRYTHIICYHYHYSIPTIILNGGEITCLPFPHSFSLPQSSFVSA